MTTKDKRPFLTIVPTSNDSRPSSTVSYTKGSTSPSSVIALKQKLGDPITLSRLCSTISLDFLKYVNVMKEVKWPELSIEMHLSGSNSTSLQDQLFLTYLLCEILERKSVSLRQKLTKMAGSELPTTSLELQQAAFQALSMTSELAAIYKILKSAYDASLSPIPA